MSTIVRRLRENFHAPDCDQFDLPEGVERIELCLSDCIWFALDEAADHIERLERDRRMTHLMAKAKAKR